MKPMMRIILSLQFVFIFLWVSQAEAEEKTPCNKITYPITGQCFTVHGRLQSYNGNPIFRIWIVGTHRLLGISDSWVKYSGKDSDPTKVMMPDIQSHVLPENVRKLWPSGYMFATAIFGDYEVCPLEKEKVGWMQPVCISHATHLVSKTNH